MMRAYFVQQLLVASNLLRQRNILHICILCDRVTHIHASQVNREKGAVCDYVYTFSAWDLIPESFHIGANRPYQHTSFTFALKLHVYPALKGLVLGRGLGALPSA
jgi:hypothetical protein